MGWWQVPSSWNEVVIYVKLWVSMFIENDGKACGFLLVLSGGREGEGPTPHLWPHCSSLPGQKSL